MVTPYGLSREDSAISRLALYAFFDFCTLSFARDTPILLRDTDFDVFFRVTARWVK